MSTTIERNIVTSNPSAAVKGLGECVVCGRESSTRCSKCHQAGIDWMFFCSQEHQKLIYFAHKRVCGSIPFVWPSFSEKEVKAYHRLIREPLYELHRVSTGPGETKLEKDRKTQPWMSIAELEDECERRTNAISQPNLNEAMTQQLISSRTLLYTLTSATELQFLPHDSLSADYILSTVGRRPFDYLAFLIGSTIGHTRINWRHRHSFSLLQHRLLILVALASLVRQEDHGSEGKRTKMGYFSHSIEVFVKSVQAGEATTQSGESVVILEKLLPTLMGEFGATFF